jgi:hypothetical protein
MSGDLGPPLERQDTPCQRPLRTLQSRMRELLQPVDDYLSLLLILRLANEFLVVEILKCF